FAVCMLITIVVPFILTVLFRKYNILNKVDTAPIRTFGKKEYRESAKTTN
ncbi:hypothetical protein KDG26_002740, partial [Listeria monocytogenes]|nr:hypothetical protein [Listeria monocytogenes]